MQVSKNIKRVSIIPRVSGVGGMVSFAAKLAHGLTARNIEVTSDIQDERADAVLIIGGTRQLLSLRKHAKRGIPVVQRLDGINWLHRQLRTGFRHWLRAEIGNWLLAYIRERVATQIVYQSQFVKGWWERKHGNIPAKTRVIHNGVDLELFKPHESSPPMDHIRVLMVEGNLQGGYELGIESAVALAEGLRAEGNQVELTVAGLVNDRIAEKWIQRTKVKIDWLGVIPNQDLPAIYQRAHILFSGDINAACPNSVIEAMACGLPVLAFDTGALNELVSENSGKVVSFGGDPWKLDKPDIPGLVKAANEILGDQKNLRRGARANAEKRFGLTQMTDTYIEVLSG